MEEVMKLNDRVLVHIQSRNYEDPARTHTGAAYLSLTDYTDVQQVELVSGAITYGTSTFYQDPYYTYDCRSGSCFVNGQGLDSYSWLNLTVPLPASTYQFKTTLTDGTLLTKTRTTAGHELIPYVHSATMENTLDASGNLVLSWELPTGEANWAQVNELRVTIFGPNMELNVKLPSTQTSVSIPAYVLANVGISDTDTFVDGWHIDTRANNSANMNYARGRSMNIVLFAGGGATPPTPALEFVTADVSGMTLYNLWSDSTTGLWDSSTIAFASDGTAAADQGLYEQVSATPSYPDATWNIDSQGLLYLTDPDPTGTSDYWMLTARQTNYFDVCYGETATEAMSCSWPERLYTDFTAAQAVVAP